VDGISVGTTGGGVPNKDPNAGGGVAIGTPGIIG
jgi:hypothetical protein